MEAREKLLKLLKECGAVEVRSNRHPRWRLPNGHMVTTPNYNDTGISWDNSYSFIRRRLEPVADRKKAREEERVKPKEEPKPKPQPQKRSFLATLPERAFIPAPAPPPPVIDRLPRAFEVNSDQPEPLPRHGPRIAKANDMSPAHTTPHHYGRGAWQRPGGRSGEGKAYSTFTVGEANRILSTYGECEYKKYMDSVHNKTSYEEPSLIGTPVQQQLELPRVEEKREELHMPETTSLSFSGSIEETLKRTKEVLLQLQNRKAAMVVQIDFEIEKCKRTIAGLEQVVQVSQMTIEDFRTTAPSPVVGTNGNGANGHYQNRATRTPWKESTRLVISTATKPLTKTELRGELQKLHPDVPIKTLYNGMSNMVSTGWLVEKMPEGLGYYAVFINENVDEG